MLNSLISIRKNVILVLNSDSTIDFNDLPKKITLFTNSEIATAMANKLEKLGAVFILEKDKSKVDYRQRFDNSEDFIFELADKLYQYYKKEANGYSSIGEIMLAKMSEDEANKIHSILKTAYKSVIANNDSASSTK